MDIVMGLFMRGWLELPGILLRPVSNSFARSGGHLALALFHFQELDKM
jgi:hypothetical protein